MDTDWSKVDSIRAEWPQSSLDPAADLQKFQHALALYERDDYASMMQCATMFASALAHSLYGPGILRGNQLPETVHKTLYCSLSRPPDGRTFAESAQKAARLALTIMRENGWQPTSFGGTSPVSEAMIMDKGNYMLLSGAIAPVGQPWLGNLKAFFAVPPSPIAGPLPDPEAGRGREMLDRPYNTVLQSESGDTASLLYAEGLRLTAKGELDGAIAKYAEAARLGSVDAMASAGDLARDLGRSDESRFWYESAANAGHSVGMCNAGIAAAQNGDYASAAQWFQRAVEADNVNGYEGLTRLALNAGDKATEEHWARIGAERGQLFCMCRYGLILARSADGDAATQCRAREFLEQAAERGDLDSAALAVMVNQQLGDRTRAQRFVDIVVQSGDAEAIDRLRRYGFL